MNDSGESDPHGSEQSGDDAVPDFHVGHRFGTWLEHGLSRVAGGQTLLMILVAAVVGVAAGHGAIGFRYLIEWINGLAFPAGITTAELTRAPWYRLLLAPAVGGLLVGPLVHFLAREARGHGVPEVMQAVASRGGRIRPRVAVVKALASALNIGTGGSVGREGPIVQIGSTIGSMVGDFLGMRPDQLRTLVACGAAAGIGATFNAPIAGILFAAELILGRGSVRVFSPIVVASVLATVTVQAYLGNFPAFRVPIYQIVSLWEVGLYVVLGLMAGFVGAGFTRALYAMEELWERAPGPPYARAWVGGALVGAMALLLPQVMGVGYDYIEQVLDWSSPDLPLFTAQGAVLLLAIAGMKVLATSTTIGSGGSGGVFAPSLLIGASVGGAFGAGVQAVAPRGLVASPGAYALVGMGCLVAATTHAPLTAILIVFELTTSYTIMLPLMLGCIIATIVSMQISRDSIYTLKLTRSGSSAWPGPEAELMTTTEVREVAREPEDAVGPATPVMAVIERVIDRHHPRLCVVDREGRLLGMIQIDDVATIMADQAALQPLLVGADLMRPAPPPLREHDTLSRALKLLSERQVQELPVVDAGGRLIGVVSQGDILGFYNREILFRGAVLKFVEEHTVGRVDEERVALATGEVVQEIPVAGQLAGRSLRELDLRARFGVSVFAIKSEHEDTTFPRADQRLEAGQRLEVCGPREQVARVRALARE